jgi:hypothetical protein
MALFAFIGGEIVMQLWNWLLPQLFGIRQITFWQALGILTLCRIWSYAVCGRILTKRGAGLWAAPLLPEASRAIVTAAVRARYEGAAWPGFADAALEELRKELLRRIRDDAPSLS